MLQLPETFETGDIVYLRSGSSPMPVTQVKDGFVGVTYSKAGELRFNHVPPQVLTKFRSEESNIPDPLALLTRGKP